ncbi:MAG: pantetheine-phosphate adenylyltransferase, partial [Candidatus Omnitrophota bacterium]
MRFDREGYSPAKTMECLKARIIYPGIENDLSFKEALNAADNFMKERRGWFKVSYPRTSAKRKATGSLRKNSRDGGERQSSLSTSGTSWFPEDRICDATDEGIITVYPGYFKDDSRSALYRSVIWQGLKVFEKVAVLVMALPEETREDFAQKVEGMSALTQGISKVTVTGVFNREELPEFFARKRIHHLIRKIYSDLPGSFNIDVEEAIARENYEEYGLDTVFILPEAEHLEIDEALLEPFILAFRDMLENQGVSVPAGEALDSRTVKPLIPRLRNLNLPQNEEPIYDVDINARKGRGPPVTARNTDSIYFPHNYPQQYIPNRHTAFYAGTFDPFTNGHLEVVRRAAAMFDSVYIGIGPNQNKEGKQWFSRQENRAMIDFCLKTAGITNVKVICYDGLTVDCARSFGAGVLLRGVRDYKDLKSELPLAWANLLLAPSIPTVFLVPYKYTNVSSSYVKELLRKDAPVRELLWAIPYNILQPFLRRYRERGGRYQPGDESLGFDGGVRADMVENYSWGAVRGDGGVHAIEGFIFMLAGFVFQGVWGGILFGAAVLLFISEDDIAEKSKEESPLLYLILAGAIIPLGLLSYVFGLDFPAGTCWGLAITCFDIALKLPVNPRPQAAVAGNLDGGNIKKTSSPVERMDGGGELPPLLASGQGIPSLRWELGMWMLPKEMRELLRRPCEIKVNKITGLSAETLSSTAVELLRQKNRLANLGLLDLQTIYRAELDQNTSLVLIPDQRDINLEGFLEIFMDKNTQKIIGYGLSHLFGGDLSLGMHFFKEYRPQHRAREIFPSRLAVVNSIFESNEYKLDRLIIPSRQINNPDALGAGALIFYLRFGFRPEGERLNDIAVKIIEGIVYNGERIQTDILRLFSQTALNLPLENTKDGGYELKIREGSDAQGIIFPQLNTGTREEKGGMIVYWHSDRKGFVYTVYDPDEKVSVRVCLKLTIGIIAAEIESYIQEIINFYNIHSGYIGYGFKRLVPVVVSKHNGTNSSGAKDGGRAVLPLELAKLEGELLALVTPEKYGYGEYLRWGIIDSGARIVAPEKLFSDGYGSCICAPYMLFRKINALGIDFEAISVMSLTLPWTNEGKSLSYIPHVLPVFYFNEQWYAAGITPYDRIIFGRRGIFAVKKNSIRDFIRSTVYDEYTFSEYQEKLAEHVSFSLVQDVRAVSQKDICSGVPLGYFRGNVFLSARFFRFPQEEAFNIKFKWDNAAFNPKEGSFIEQARREIVVTISENNLPEVKEFMREQDTVSLRKMLTGKLFKSEYLDVKPYMSGDQRRLQSAVWGSAEYMRNAVLHLSLKKMHEDDLWAELRRFRAGYLSDSGKTADGGEDFNVLLGQIREGVPAKIEFSVNGQVKIKPLKAARTQEFDRFVPLLNIMPNFRGDFDGYNENIHSRGTIVLHSVPNAAMIWQLLIIGPGPSCKEILLALDRLPLLEKISVIEVSYSNLVGLLRDTLNLRTVLAQRGITLTYYYCSVTDLDRVLEGDSVDMVYASLSLGTELLGKATFKVLDAINTVLRDEGLAAVIIPCRGPANMLGVTVNPLPDNSETVHLVSLDVYRYKLPDCNIFLLAYDKEDAMAHVLIMWPKQEVRKLEPTGLEEIDRLLGIDGGRPYADNPGDRAISGPHHFMCKFYFADARQISFNYSRLALFVIIARGWFVSGLLPGFSLSAHWGLGMGGSVVLFLAFVIPLFWGIGIGHEIIHYCAGTLFGQRRLRIVVSRYEGGGALERLFPSLFKSRDALLAVDRTKVLGIADNFIRGLYRILKPLYAFYSPRQVMESVATARFSSTELFDGGKRQVLTDMTQPKRMTIEECRREFCDNLKEVDRLWREFQKRVPRGQRILEFEGVEAFEKSAWPEIREVVEDLRTHITRIRFLPALLGFVEPDIKARLDALLSWLAEEVDADKVLIRFHIIYQYDFCYSLGFTVKELEEFYLNLSDIFSYKAASFNKEEMYRRHCALLRKCGIESLIEGSVDYEICKEDYDKIISVYLGRSPKKACTSGMFNEEDEKSLGELLNNLARKENTPWSGIRDFMGNNSY